MDQVLADRIRNELTDALNTPFEHTTTTDKEISFLGCVNKGKEDEVNITVIYHYGDKLQRIIIRYNNGVKHLVRNFQGLDKANVSDIIKTYLDALSEKPFNEKPFIHDNETLDEMKGRYHQARASLKYTPAILALFKYNILVLHDYDNTRYSIAFGKDRDGLGGVGIEFGDEGFSEIAIMDNNQGEVWRAYKGFDIDDMDGVINYISEMLNIFELYRKGGIGNA